MGGCFFIGFICWLFLLFFVLRRGGGFVLVFTWRRGFNELRENCYQYKYAVEKLFITFVCVAILNTFYLRLYGVRHMVKDHSDSEKGNPLPPHGLLRI